MRAKLPEGVPWQAAVCLDPADFALGAIRDGHIRLGDAVAVFGMGAIGLFVVQLAKLAGAYPVIAVDPIPLRRDVALECGADTVMDPTACDAGLEIKLATDRRGADVCVDYSGHYSALQAALRGVAYLGTVVAGAWPAATPPASTWVPKPISTGQPSFSPARAANPTRNTPTGMRPASFQSYGAFFATAA